MWIERITKAKEEFWLNNQSSPELMVIRPELKLELVMEVYKMDDFEEALEFDLTHLLDMDICISEDATIPDFRLAVYSCSL